MCISVAICCYVYYWRGGATGKAFGLAISRLRVQILLEATLCNNLRHVVYTYVPLSPSSITWYRPKGGDALRLGRYLQAWQKVMAAYRRLDDLRSPAGWLPVHRDQLRAQRSVSSMGSLYLLPFTSTTVDVYCSPVTRGQGKSPKVNHFPMQAFSILCVICYMTDIDNWSFAVYMFDFFFEQ